MSEHTQGPWVADIRGGCCAVYPADRKGDSPGLYRDQERNIHYSDQGAAFDGSSWDMSNEARANAHLIAAAPDLLAACKLAERHHQGMHSEPGIALRAAIAKAEGR